jgi:NADH dehydrogenase
MDKETFIRILILGMGYGGLRLALDLERGVRRGKFQAEITLIDQYPFHQLVTEMHQVAAGSVPSEYSTILVDKVLKKKRIRFQQARVTGFAPHRKVVETDHGDFQYDRLVIALGGEADFFDQPSPRIPGLREHGFSIQSIQPANRAYMQLQERLFQFIQVQKTTPGTLYLIIGGGGTTGVEMAGQLADEIPKKCREYKIPREAIQVDLIEGTDRLLPGFHPEIANYAARILERKGIRLHLGVRITDVQTDRLTLSSGETLPMTILIWAGGVRANRLFLSSPFKIDTKGRIIANGYLQADNNPDVFAIGDCSSYIHSEMGLPSAPTARLAVDQGGWLARYLMGRTRFPFVPSFKGGVISLGKDAAVAIVGELTFFGRIAYLMKSFVTVKYIYSIGGLRLLFHQLRMGVLGKI